MAVPNVALAEVAEVEAEAATSSVADVAEAEVIISEGTTMTSMCSLQSGPETSWTAGPINITNVSTIIIPEEEKEVTGKTATTTTTPNTIIAMTTLVEISIQLTLRREEREAIDAVATITETINSSSPVSSIKMVTTLTNETATTTPETETAMQTTTTIAVVEIVKSATAVVKDQSSKLE